MEIVKEEMCKIEKLIMDYRKDIFLKNIRGSKVKNEELDLIKKEERRISKIKKIIKDTENTCSERVLEKYTDNISKKLQERLSFFNDISSYHYQMNKLIEKIKEK
jgi:DNA repair ATPase RecN